MGEKKAYLKAINDTEMYRVYSLLPHLPRFQNGDGVFKKKGHKSDELAKLLKPYSEPQIVETKDMTYVQYNYVIPTELRPFYARGTKRIKVKKGINRFKGEERLKAAEEIREKLSMGLKLGIVNPFASELKWRGLAHTDALKDFAVQNLTDEQKRMQTSCHDAFLEFIASRKRRKVDKKTITTYQNTINWLSSFLEAKNMLYEPISNVRHIHISAALDKVAKEEKWVATTINKQVMFAMTIFNFLETEDYIVKNPSKGKFIPLRTTKTKHKWYDKDTAKIVKKAILDAGEIGLYRACAFTYWILIRSKEELRNIKVGDIDLDLHRISFRKEWTKNSEDQFRDYPDEFHTLLLEMGIDKYPKDYYVFGKDGVPAPVQCGHNYFSRKFLPIRERLKLSDDYTIYGWKHTRIIHLMMLGTDGYEISFIARHGDTKTTEDYKRDYDFSIKYKYGAGDLKF